MTESFYSTHLPESSRSIFSSMYSGELFKRSDAILYSTIPPSPVRRVLEVLKPKPIVKPTAPVRARLRKAGLVVVGPVFVGQLLLNNGGAERVREELGDNELASLLVWLNEEEGINLQGLPLLRLENKTWAKFETGGQVYYSSPSSSKFVKDDLLPSGRFVYPATMPKTLLKTLSTSTIKVAVLDAAGVGQLVEEKLQTLDPQTKAAWVERFWKVFPTFLADGLQVHKSIETLPLVPTLSGTSFKSLLECKENGFFTDSIDSGWLVECFKDLGIDVVPLNRFPSALREVLRSTDYSLQATQFNRFLRCVSPILNSAVQSFKGWPSDRRNKFSEWVRGRITTKVSEEFAHTVRQLPVWPARKGMETSLCSANEVTLLPLGISIDAGRFCRSFMTAEGGVSHLGVTRQTLTQLYVALDLPHKLLPGEDEEIYKNLLTNLLNLSNRDVQRIQVPNTSRVMVNCDTLFERTTFFTAAFGESSDRFLLQSFDSFASRLYSRGLKRITDLDLDLFSLCARTFQDECASALQDGGRLDHWTLERAQIVYRTYCETLPLHVSSGQAGRWHTLDNIRFIPRNMHEGRRYVSQDIELPESIRSLPRLVSPKKVVQSKFHGISWTQRVALEQQPLDRLLVAFPDFGKPSTKEVVAHLKELTSPSHGSIVLPDLIATYEWLNQQDTSVLESLRPELQESSMFLNVDDPKFDAWRWCKARQMAFETHDVGRIEGVRQFLSPFKRLLKAAGVLEAFYPKLEARDDARIPDERDLLKQYRDGFSELRAMNQLVDVIFTPEDEAITDACRPLLSAHRAFLSVCNTHLKDRFTGVYADSRAAASDNGLLNISLQASSFAITTALDYLYTGQALAREKPIELEDLLQTLELSGYLQIDGLFHLAQREVVERRLVDPLNFTDVRNRATAINADVLTRWCDEYETRNLEFIRFAAEGNATVN